MQDENQRQFLREIERERYKNTKGKNILFFLTAKQN